MIIVLGSKSQIKQDAVRNALTAFGVQSDLMAVAALSGIAEQPFDEETMQGARNRASHAAELAPGADFALAIESGIFRNRGNFLRARCLDIALVVVRLPSGEFISAESDPVEFPEDAVEETIKRGVRDWTCGKVMQEWGVVAKHDDPHLSLSGKSRSEFINDAVVRLFEDLRDRGLI